MHLLRKRYLSSFGAPRPTAYGPLLAALALVCLLVLCGCSPSHSSSVDPALQRFAQTNKACARAWVKEQKLTIPSAAWSLFDATSAGRWEDATNAYYAVRKARGWVGPPGKRSWAQTVNDSLLVVLVKLGYKPKPPTALQTEVHSVLNETYGAMEQFQAWDNRLLHLYGETIISAIPSNSIYFGGTDSGRYIISALCESQKEGRPFFTLTQNALADNTYLLYLQKIYGAKISISTGNDSQKAFSSYVAEAQLRLKAGKLKPGEGVVQTQNRIMISGQTAVMQINALLVRDIFDKNPGREFYVEQSSPLDWMYPYLSPHGPVLKLNRQPLPELSESVVLKDRDYWKRLTAELLGEPMSGDISFTNVCDFVRRVYLTNDLSGFKGNTRYVRNAAAQQGFAWLRKNIADVYAWRAEQAQSTEERGAMRLEAERAYRQAFALGPGVSSLAGRYVQFLFAQNRRADAVEVMQLSLALNPDSAKLIDQLKPLTEK
jgi:hypothetical protein